MKNSKPKVWSINHPEFGNWEMEWSDETDFENLDNVIGVQGFVFDTKGKFCVIKLSCKKKWLITGGKPEESDKTYEDTLIREVNEEADLEIKEIQRIGYVISYRKETPDKKEYSLRYVAKVAKINPQTIDPAYGEIPERKFILPEEFDKYCGWGENGEFQINKAIEKITDRSKLPLRKNCEGYFVLGDKIVGRDTKYGYIDFPGGGADDDEEIIEAMRREALEEAGVILDEGLKEVGDVKTIWPSDWAKTEKQKKRFLEYKGEHMHYFVCKVKELIKPQGDSEEEGWDVNERLMPIKEAIRITESYRPFPKELEEFYEFKLKILRELDKK